MAIFIHGPPENLENHKGPSRTHRPFSKHYHISFTVYKNVLRLDLKYFTCVKNGFHSRVFCLLCKRPLCQCIKCKIRNQSHELNNQWNLQQRLASSRLTEYQLFMRRKFRFEIMRRLKVVKFNPRIKKPDLNFHRSQGFFCNIILDFLPNPR